MLKSKPVSYPCDQCQYKATHESLLSKHIKSVHDGVQFPCDKCDYKVTRKDHLLRHEKSVHEGVKYLCDQCDLYYRDKFVYQDIKE